MMNWKKTLVTVAVLPGVGLLGALTGMFLPTVPVITGLIAAVLAVAMTQLGVWAAGAVGLSFSLGAAITLGFMQPSALAFAGWYALFLLVGCLAGRFVVRKAHLGKRLITLASGLFVFTLISYIVCNLATGDVVGGVTGFVQTELAEMEAMFPPLYDMLMSTLSVNGMIRQMGLESAVYELDPQTRDVLTASFLELFDSSLRLGLMEMLAGLALHFSLMFITADMMSRKREKLALLVKYLRVQRGLTIVLVGGLVVFMVLSAVWDAAYPIYLMWSTVFNFVFMVQGMALVEWFLLRRGWRAGFRWTLIALGYVLLPYLLFLLGFLEQIFSFRRMTMFKEAGLDEDQLKEVMLGDRDVPWAQEAKALFRSERNESDEDDEEDEDEDD